MKKTQKPKQEAIFRLIGFSGLIVLLILAALVPNAAFFQSRLSLRPAAGLCKSLHLTSVPDPLGENESAAIAITVEPNDFSGTFRASSSSGLLSDNKGNNGSVIETPEKILAFSGGEAGSRITVQAAGEGNEKCLATIEIFSKTETTPCTELLVTTDPSPVVANDSAELALSTNPPDWFGTFLIEAESGKLFLATADPGAQGEQSSSLITSSRKILYGGGKASEIIRVKALGEQNEACQGSVTIVAK